jgi:hypothetical protein
MDWFRCSIDINEKCQLTGVVHLASNRRFDLSGFVHLTSNGVVGVAGAERLAGRDRNSGAARREFHQEAVRGQRLDSGPRMRDRRRGDDRPRAVGHPR